MRLLLEVYGVVWGLVARIYRSKIEPYHVCDFVYALVIVGSPGTRSSSSVAYLRYNIVFTRFLLLVHAVLPNPAS